MMLTDYETGEAIYVRRDAIKSARRLSAEVFDNVFVDGIVDGIQEEGARTRIDTASDMFLVRETVLEVIGTTAYGEGQRK